MSVAAEPGAIDLSAVRASAPNITATATVKTANRIVTFPPTSGAKDAGGSITRDHSNERSRAFNLATPGAD